MNNFSNIKLFSVKELFPLIVNGKGNNNLLSDGDSTPYLGAKKDENGVMRYCAKDSALTLKGNVSVSSAMEQGPLVTRYIWIDPL